MIGTRACAREDSRPITASRYRTIETFLMALATVGERQHFRRYHQAHQKLSLHFGITEYGLAEVRYRVSKELSFSATFTMEYTGMILKNCHIPPTLQDAIDEIIFQPLPDINRHKLIKQHDQTAIFHPN